MPQIDARLAAMHHALTECAEMIAVLRKEREDLKRLYAASKAENEGLIRLIASLNGKEDAA
jgi:hypothetical protein